MVFRWINILLVLLIFFRMNSQYQNTGNDILPPYWPDEVSRVEIVSSYDGKIQPAVFMASKGEQPQPLVVSLHTWSHGFEQKDTLV